MIMIYQWRRSESFNSSYFSSSKDKEMTKSSVKPTVIANEMQARSDSIISLEKPENYGTIIPEGFGSVNL